MNKSKKKYCHLTQKERDRLEAMLVSGHKQKEIADVLKVHKSTISREIKRNRRRKLIKGGIVWGQYESDAAQHKVMLRKSNSRYQGKKIDRNEKLQEYIIERVKAYWSPDEISGKMKKEKQPFYASKNTIYEWLYGTCLGWTCCQYLYSQRRKPRKQKKKAKKVIIPNRISILLRPKRIGKEFGHHESDTAVSGKKTGSRAALAVDYERKAKYISLEKISSLKPNEFNRAMKKIGNRVSVETRTLDNGIENQFYEQLGVKTYFCEPYSSWQKGGVENAIKMIRRFFPKGCDISNYPKEYIKMVEYILNNKPRKSLGYKSAYEVMVENNLFLRKQNPQVALEG